MADPEYINNLLADRQQFLKNELEMAAQQDTAFLAGITACTAKASLKVPDHMRKMIDKVIDRILGIEAAINFENLRSEIAILVAELNALAAPVRAAYARVEEGAEITRAQANSILGPLEAWVTAGIARVQAYIERWKLSRYSAARVAAIQAGVDVIRQEGFDEVMLECIGGMIEISCPVRPDFDSDV